MLWIALALALVHADVSSLATTIWTGGCGTIDATAASSALERVAACRPGGGSSAIAGLRLLARRITGDVEDAAFTELGAREATELKCAADFARQLADGDATAVTDLVGKLKALRAARVAWTDAIKELRADRNSSGRMCPTTLNELTAQDVATPQFRDICARVIAARGATEVITAAVPLGGEAHVQKFLSEVANADVSDEDLGRRGRQVFGDAAAALQAQTEALRARVNAQAGPQFSANEKRSLLSDPRLVQSLVDEDPALGPVLCRADLNYGARGDALVTGLTIGTLGVGFGATMSLKAATYAANFARAAFVARTAGQISIGTARIFQAAALAAATGTAARQIQRVCSPRKMNVRSNGRTCASAPSVAQLAEDNCALGATLSALNVATSLPAGSWAMFAPAVRALPGIKAFTGTIAAEAKAAEAVPAPQKFLKPGALAHQPRVSPSMPDPMGETRHSRVVTIDGRGKELGRFEYSIDAAKNRLEIEWVRVADDVKNEGVSKAMFAQILTEHPEIKEVKTVMSVDNLEKVKEALALNPDDCAGAMLQTPAAKMRVSLGFTKVIRAVCRPNETREGAYLLIQGR